MNLLALWNAMSPGVHSVLYPFGVCEFIKVPMQIESLERDCIIGLLSCLCHNNDKRVATIVTNMLAN